MWQADTDGGVARALRFWPSEDPMLQRLIERLFGTTIRPMERRLVALLALDLFLLLTVYYILKIVREPLILLEGGVVSRNAARGAQAVILVVLVPAYSLLANRTHPRRLVSGVFTFFLVSLLAFPLLIRLRAPLGFAFFVWLGIFSITAVAQFWSLANDVFSEEAGKRLFPVIAAGATLGAIVGSQIVVVTSRWLTPTGLILVAAGLLAACIGLTHYARHAAEALPSTPPNGHTPDQRGGFRLVLSNPYLLLIGLTVLLLNVINTTGDQVMAMLVQQHTAELGGKAARAQFMMAFYGSFQTWVSILTAALQVFVVSRVLRKAGVGGALLVLPLVAFTGYGLLAAAPALLITRSLKIIENSTEYSLQNTVQQVLFLPTSRDAKYKGKAATDTFFVRFGDLGSWALVGLALRAGWTATKLSLVNVAVAGAWTVLVLLLGRRYRQLTAAAAQATGAGTARDQEPAPLAAPARLRHT
jgi:AAA family ATP:ADP antiporter